MLDENADTTSDKEKMTNDVEMSLPTPPEIPMNIEEISNDENFEISNRPMILIKRIPLSEAENYLPDCYKTRWFQIFFCSFLRIEQQENLLFQRSKNGQNVEADRVRFVQLVVRRNEIHRKKSNRRPTFQSFLRVRQLFYQIKRKNLDENFALSTAKTTIYRHWRICQ